MSGPGLVTREATPADAAALLGLMRQLAQFEGYAQHFAVAERDLIERGLAATGAPEFTAIVAEQPPGPPCGYAVVHDLRFTYDLRPTVILKELFVAGVDRGGGAGSALMAAVLAYARRAGAGAAVLERAARQCARQGVLSPVRRRARHGMGALDPAARGGGAMTGALLLDPRDPAVRRALDDQVGAEIARGLAEVAAGGVAVTLEPDELARQLAMFDFAAPRALPDVVAWLVDVLSRGIVPTTHPRYLGLYNPAPAFASECADRIAAAFNPQLAVWSHAPAAVEIERHVIRAVLARIGHADGGGHFTSGGAEANLTALVCALNAACPDYAERGACAFPGPPVFYASREGHLTWIKIAHMCGLGRSALRLVDTDGTGRLDPAALAGQLARDRAAGAVPVLIAATAGTTSAGAIDPLVSCAEIAAAAGVWLHVDAAWGGALLASDRLRHHLTGIERADSATIDAHKWFAATMGTGMFLTRRPELLARAFDVRASYMPSHDAARDPYLTSAQWSRRFVGARLFLGLAAAGWAGYARHVEHATAMAARLSLSLTAAGWTVVNASPVAVVCVVPPAGSPPARAVVDDIAGRGAAWLSLAELERREVIRMCVTNGRTQEADIDAVAAALIAAARRGA